MVKLLAAWRAPVPRFIGRKWKQRRADLVIFRIHPRAPPPPGDFSKFIFVSDKLVFKISYSIYFDYTYPPFPPFLGRQWKLRSDYSGLFQIQPRAPLPSGGFSKFVFVVKIFYFKSIIVEEQYPLWLEGWRLSATKINSEKLLAGGGARGSIRNSPE